MQAEEEVTCISWSSDNSALPNERDNFQLPVIIFVSSLVCPLGQFLDKVLECFPYRLFLTS